MKAKPNTDEDRFYVYGHFTEDTNELFYIGKGCAKRAWSKVGRPQRWQDIATKGYTVKLLHEKLTESESLVLETAFEACKEYKESIRDVLLLIGIPERVIDYGS